VRSILGLLLLSTAVAGCETTTTAPNSTLFGQLDAEYEALLQKYGPDLPVDMDGAFGCMMDLTIARSFVDEDGGVSEDDQISNSVLRNISEVYRERVRALEAADTPPPAYADGWWQAAVDGTSDSASIQAIMDYGTERLAAYDAESETAFGDSVDTCRKTVVDQMTPEDVEALALNAVLRSVE